jgi:replicative superfamily II helicase
MLDIQQIFGRAGRPQFDDSGEAILVCEHEKLNKYLNLLTHALPIESQFIAELPNHLNAEIILGTVSTLAEAVEWLSYTYLYTRMLRNPIAYGIKFDDMQSVHCGKGWCKFIFSISGTQSLCHCFDVVHCHQVRRVAGAAPHSPDH